MDYQTRVLIKLNESVHMKSRVAISRIIILALLLSPAILPAGCDNDQLWTSASQPTGEALLLTLALASQPKLYTVRVYVNTFTSSFQIQNGSDTLTITEPNIYPFPTGMKNGDTYNVIISTQPTIGTCTIIPGTESGTINNADVLVTINCI